MNTPGCATTRSERCRHFRHPPWCAGIFGTGAPEEPFHMEARAVSHGAMGETAQLGEAGFEVIVATHHGEIYRYLRRLAWRMSEADDLSQETFLRAYRARARLTPDANVRAWLFTIATNVFRNHVRSERRRRAAHDTVRATRRELETDGPEAEAVAGEVRTLAETAIRALPLKQRLAFTLRKMHELDYELIGQSLDCSADSARAHVFQALRKIRTSLNGHALPHTESTR
jgi:RNA polymerase sigma-70 factor (ECF subfamily)